MPTLDSTHPLAVELATGRERYNALFEAARVRHGALDGDDVLAVLAEIAPLAEATDADRIVAALYPVVLDAVGRSLVGPSARQPEVGAAWTRAIVACRLHVAREPKRIAKALLAALGTVGATSNAHPLRWADRLSELADAVDTPDALLNAGAVLAWREGLARYRTAALDACTRLARSTALAALGVTDTAAHRDALATALERLRADPWCLPEAAFSEWTDDRPLAVRTVCGGFVGYGGPFHRPPQLHATVHGIAATDGTAAFRLHADAFGTAFERVDLDQVTDASSSAGRTSRAEVGSDGTVRWNGRAQRFDELANTPSAASTSVTLAAVVADSHWIALVAPAP